MEKKLVDFVKQQAKLKADPDKLREGLILHGWNKEQVDKAINNVYNKNHNLLAYSGAIVLILLAALFFVFKGATNIPVDDPDPGLPQVDRQHFESVSCVNVDILDKDDCYFEKIGEGYTCNNLQGNDLFFCTRAMDYYLLS